MRPLGLLILCLNLSLAFNCERRLSFDAQGVPHGTGEHAYTYASGVVKLRDTYKAGQLVRSRWYAPNGNLIQETNWHNGEGDGIYLRDDGSIKTRMTYVNGVAEGEATNYDEAGHPTKVMYHAGKPVQPTSAPSSQQSAARQLGAQFDLAMQRMVDRPTTLPVLHGRKLDPVLLRPSGDLIDDRQ